MWKGTGYYYSRFRPGLGSVLTGLLLVFGGGGHYLALVLGWKRQREFVDRYIRQARRAAWGDELGVHGIPGLDSASATAPSTQGGDSDAMPVNRRQKRMMERGNRKDGKKGAKAARDSGTSTPTESAGPTGERKRVVAENGKMLIVDSTGNVFLEEETEEGDRQEFLLDIDEIRRPTVRDTMLFQVPIWCFQKSVGRLTGSSQAGDLDVDEEPEEIVEREEPRVRSGSSRRRGKRSQRS